jgi:hypothetical protein
MEVVLNKLFENSISSIQIGVEDYFTNDAKRISSCVRNLFSGILLLFKAKLLDMCPLDSNEVLIKKEIIPMVKDGNLRFIGKGKTTIDIREIQQRFRSLNIKTDWTIIEKIQKERNNIEHYHTFSSVDILKSLIVSTFTIVNDFIRNEIGLNPKDLLGETWTKMIKLREVYLKEKLNCENKIGAMFSFEEDQMLIVKNMYCESCGSELLVPISSANNINNAMMRCTVCENNFKVIDMFEKVVENVFDIDGFENAKMGITNIKECPECGKFTFAEKENRCYFCSYEKEYTECERCGAGLSLEEQECEGLCFYCYDQFEKMMDDD